MLIILLGLIIVIAIAVLGANNVNNNNGRQIIYDYQIIDMFDYEMTKPKIFTEAYIEKLYNLSFL